MGINTALAGRVYPPSPVYEVSREKIAEFATAIRSDDPAHVDPEAARALGHPDVVAPPTFAVIIAQRAEGQVFSDPESGVDFSRLVHGEERFTYHRPIVCGDRLTATLHVETARAHHPGRDRGRRRGTGQHREVHGRHPRTGVTMALRSFADVAVGEKLPSRQVRLRRVDLVRYAGASGDFNVIHWNERAARAVGLPDVIAHGMLTMAVAGRVVTDWAGDPGCLVEYGTKFTRPVPVPDDDTGATVELSGVVSALDPDARIARVDLVVICGEETVLGKAQAKVRLA
jgi:acyl dehydratase